MSDSLNEFTFIALQRYLNLQIKQPYRAVKDIQKGYQFHRIFFCSDKGVYMILMATLYEPADILVIITVMMHKSEGLLFSRAQIRQNFLKGRRIADAAERTDLFSL